MSAWENPEKTLKKAEIFIRHAADCGAKLICFPEQFATGWDPKPKSNIQARRQLTGNESGNFHFRFADLWYCNLL